MSVSSSFGELVRFFLPLPPDFHSHGFQIGTEYASVGCLKELPNDGVRVCMMYTPPEHRQKGYASALVASIAEHAIKTRKKRYCTIATDLGNPTSNAIYERVGFAPYTDFGEYHFSH